MIKNIIYVEDGSVDVDELKQVVGRDTHVIVYRQGAPKPEVLALSVPLVTAQDEEEYTLRRRLEATGNIFADLHDMKMTKKVRRKIQQLHDILFKV